MNRIAISLLSVCILAFASVARSDEPQPPTKKYHVYTLGCRLGAREVLATDNIREASEAAATLAKEGSDTKIVAGPHTRTNVISGSPTQYEVFRIGQRCGNLFSVGTTRKEAEIAEFTKKINAALSVVVVSYQ